jgi:hypothetical protein
MGRSLWIPPRSRKRLWLITAAAISAAIIVVIGIATNGFGIGDSEGRTNTPDSPEQTAQDRCESEVLKRLASPSTASLSNIEATRSVLDPDSQDLFSLLDDPLKGIDRSRITVWNVSGVAESQNAFGSTIHDRFTCRAYFIDDDFADTLVVFDHDH